MIEVHLLTGEVFRGEEFPSDDPAPDLGVSLWKCWPEGAFENLNGPGESRYCFFPWTAVAWVDYGEAA